MRTRDQAIALVLLAAFMAGDVLAATPLDALLGDPARWERDRQRDAHSKPAEILAFSGVEPGMQVLDIFSGGGYWTELFAAAVGTDGRVVAHTNAAFRNFSGKVANARYKDGRLANVDVLDSEMDNLRFGQDRFDLVILSLGFHDLYFHADFWPQPGGARFLAQVHDALKPDGILLVIDHAAAAGTGATQAQTSHRIEPAFARRMIEAHGFTFDGESDVLRNTVDDPNASVFDDAVRGQTDRFVFRFRKRETP